MYGTKRNYQATEVRQGNQSLQTKNSWYPKQTNWYPKMQLPSVVHIFKSKYIMQQHNKNYEELTLTNTMDSNH